MVSTKKVEVGGDALQQVGVKVVDVMRDANLRPDEVLNVMLNLLARSALLICMEKEELIEAVTMAYELHLSHEGDSETLN